MNTMNTNMLVKIQGDANETIRIQIFDRQMKRSAWFYLVKKDIQSKLFADGSFVDIDLNNVCRMYLKGDNTILMTMYFLNENYSMGLNGYLRTFSIPVDSIRDALAGKNVRLLTNYNPMATKAQINVSTRSGFMLEDMPMVMRRAFCKAIRNHFNYSNSTINLYKHDDEFSFNEISSSGRVGICGGLCLHQTMIEGKDGHLHEKLYYSVHT